MSSLPFRRRFVSFNHFILLMDATSITAFVLFYCVVFILVQIVRKEVLFHMTWLACSILSRHEKELVAKAYWSFALTTLHILPHSDLHTLTGRPIRPIKAASLFKWDIAHMLRFSLLNVLVTISLIKACNQHLLMSSLTFSALAHGTVTVRLARALSLDRWTYFWLIREWVHTVI